MKSEIFKFFDLQRQIFGICPRSGEFFRLSDCQIFLKDKPQRDWLDSLERKEGRLDRQEERLDEKEEEIREAAREKGRRLASKVIRKIDPVFTPRQLDADDAKVIFHPVDFVVFDGMCNREAIDRLLILDRDDKKGDQRDVQRKIERAVDKGRYEWRTLRVLDTGNVSVE